jgi:hypothetical protein
MNNLPDEESQGVADSAGRSKSAIFGRDENSYENESFEPDKKMNHTPVKIPFWTENPNVLLDPTYLFEIFPVEKMTFAQKLNAVSRMLIFATVALFMVSQNPNVLLASLITMGAIAVVFYTQRPKSGKKVRFDLEEDNAAVESFAGLAKHTLESEDKYIQSEIFDISKPNNPFSNVLLTDYENNPNKKPAPASYNTSNNTDILAQAKEFVKEANPDQPDIADKLFKNLGDELQFEQSMRPFYSTPNTRVMNDQQAFADFCYGSMVSCKEGNMFACSRKYQAMPSTA